MSYIIIDGYRTLVQRGGPSELTRFFMVAVAAKPYS
jgi:hypothetical protein